ncbi:response regulator transcription factor [Pseudalkalibacillus sp. Hm43]|uniref:response regulator transcription factor n=1 Tax=Pseudalkalibacillus sp. Hm43 TaxID=3450742 RepID=UPI003F42150E
MVRVLIADDDPNILELISLYIGNEGYQVVKAKDGQDAIEQLESERIDLAIIDLMMPKVDGYELCEEIRQYYKIPVLMVTAKGETKDKVKGFQLGTDDYVVKPFDPLEIVMRVKALLRRYQVEASNELKTRNVTMNTSKKEIQVDGERLTMPLKEFELLYTLASYPEQIFTRNQLIERIWGLDYEGDDRTIDVHIKRIRDKLSKSNAAISIKTVRGLGYKIEVFK